jgi:hypothetical protein
MYKLLSLACILAFLTGCNSTVTNLNADDDILANEDSINVGYLLIAVETDRSLKAIEIDGPRDIALSHLDLTSGSNYILVDMPAGEYEITRIEINGFYSLTLLDPKLWKVEVQANTVSYVGDLEISASGFWSRTSSVKLMNRSAEALQLMQEQYPNIMEQRLMTHGGPGDDYFLEAAQAGSDE